MPPPPPSRPPRTSTDRTDAAPVEPPHQGVHRGTSCPRTDFDAEDDDEYRPVTGQFAGIELAEFYWARQRAKRVLFFWVVAVITLTGLAAAGAWTLGTNLSTLL